jgi:hypothetical protein
LPYFQPWSKPPKPRLRSGANDWPNALQLAKTEVLVMYAQDGGNATPEQKENLAKFTKRGGIVVIHTAAVSNDPAWWKSVIGGAWVQGKTKWRKVRWNATTPGLTNQVSPTPSPWVLWISRWMTRSITISTCRPTSACWPRARPNFRATLLRGICWAGKRTNLDEFCKPEEIKALAAPGN